MNLSEDYQWFANKTAPSQKIAWFYAKGLLDLSRPLNPECVELRLNGLTSAGTLVKNGALNCVEVGKRTEAHG